MSFAAKHGIENDEQHARASGKDRLGMLALGAQPVLMAGLLRICRERRHVQATPDFGASAPDTTSAAQATAVTVKRRQAHQGGDFFRSSGRWASRLLENTAPTPGTERSN